MIDSHEKAKSLFANKTLGGWGIVLRAGDFNWIRSRFTHWTRHCCASGGDAIWPLATAPRLLRHAGFKVLRTGSLFPRLPRALEPSLGCLSLGGWYLVFGCWR
jgi:hypothetical protein